MYLHTCDGRVLRLAPGSHMLSNSQHCPVIYRVKGILDIQIQHDRDSSTSARPFQEALQFGDLPLCASVRPEAFLHFVYRLVLFYGAAKIAIHHLGKYYKLGAWLTSRSKVRHLKCSYAFGQEFNQRSKKKCNFLLPTAARKGNTVLSDQPYTTTSVKAGP